MNSVRWLKIFLCAVLPLAAQFAFAAEARLEVVTLHSALFFNAALCSVTTSSRASAAKANCAARESTAQRKIFNQRTEFIFNYLIQKHSTPNIQPSTSDGLNLAAFSVGG